MRGGRRWIAAWALLCVGLQLGWGLQGTAAALALWTLVLALAAPAALKSLARPVFWGASALVAAGSALLLGERDLPLLGVAVSAEGLRVGALMLLRGAFVLTLVGWIGRAVGREDVERWTGAVGLGGLGVALGQAGLLLPELVARLEGGLRGGGALRPGRLFELAVEAVVQAALTAESLADEEER
ncbi:MAG: hypothetical protein JXX28_00880 [Deltaproteobacteria bacterium]|nr:hypothetical protein [Deltaproteobacteria bacterium]